MTALLSGCASAPVTGEFDRVTLGGGYVNPTASELAFAMECPAGRFAVNIAEAFNPPGSYSSRTLSVWLEFGDVRRELPVTSLPGGLNPLRLTYADIDTWRCAINGDADNNGMAFSFVDEMGETDSVFFQLDGPTPAMMLGSQTQFPPN